MRHPPATNDSIARRRFLAAAGMNVGAFALASLLPGQAVAGHHGRAAEGDRGAEGVSPGSAPHFFPRAKRLIYIFQAGGPAQMELYDHKPGLQERQGEELPESVRSGRRLTGFTASQKSYPIAAPAYAFQRHGRSGAWLSELLPHLAGVVDDVCFVKSVHTEAINHDPAVTYMLTGAQQPGRPSLGAWLSYGLGSENQDLPAFVVLLSPGLIQDASTPLSARHWGSGFLASRHQGVKFRGGRDPVLYLADPPGIDRRTRRDMLDVTNQLNRWQYEAYADPEIASRIAQYELAFRMQDSLPRLTDFSDESQGTMDLYGPQSRIPGSYAASCLLARRLVERGVRFVQIFDRDWDHHRNAPQHLKTKAEMTDQPTAGLLRDLKQRGLLEDTLVVCGGEFGRTIYAQGPLVETYGRDHHGGCFTVWLAGGGIAPGMTFGETDDFSYTVVRDGVHVHDLQATILHCLGIDHRRLTFHFQSRDFRLTDVAGHVVERILA